MEGRKVASKEVSESKAADLGNKTCYQPTSSFPQICQREREREREQKKERKRERENQSMKETMTSCNAQSYIESSYQLIMQL